MAITYFDDEPKAKVTYLDDAPSPVDHKARLSQYQAELDAAKANEPWAYRHPVAAKAVGSGLDILAGPGQAAGSLISSLYSMPTATTAEYGTRIGNLTGLSTSDPMAARRAVESALQYQPSSKTGQFLVGLASSPFTVADMVVDAGANQVRKVSPGLADTLLSAKKGATDALSLLPAYGLGKAAVDEVAARRAWNAQARPATTPIAVAEQAGYKISPSSVHNATDSGGKPSLAARGTEAIAGHETVSANFIKHNKNVTNNIAAQEIGLPAGSPLTVESQGKPGTLDIAAKPHAEVYNRVKEVVDTVAPDESFLRDVSRAGRGTDSVLELPASFDKIQESVSQPMNGSQMIDTISDLRKKGWKGINAKENPDANAIGNAQLDLANALEARLGRVVKEVAPELDGAYQKARVGFAKIDTVRRSLVGHDVDPQVLKKAAAKTNAIEGGLKVIADVATHFPDEMQASVPKRSDFARAMHAATAFGSLGIYPALQHGLGGIVSATRGQQAAPRLGLSGPLGGYYRDSGSPFPERGPLTSPSRLLPAPEDVTRGADIVGQNENAFMSAKYGEFGDSRTAPPGIARLPAPGQEVGGNNYSPIEVSINDSLSPSAKGQAMKHPANPINSLETTVRTAAERKKMDHMVSVLAYRRRLDQIETIKQLHKGENLTPQQLESLRKAMFDRKAGFP